VADYLKIPELARRLDVSEKTARRYVKAGALPSTFIGGAYRVTEEDLEAFLHGAEVKPGDASPKAPPDLDAADLEDWASEVDTLDELRPVHRALWLQWRELADYDRVVGGGERALADALEAEEKRMIIDRRMMELAPAPLATIAMHLDEPTWVIYHRDPTDDERARLIAEYPDAVEVEAERVALAY